MASSTTLTSDTICSVIVNHLNDKIGCTASCLVVFYALGPIQAWQPFLTLLNESEQYSGIRKMLLTKPKEAYWFKLPF